MIITHKEAKELLDKNKFHKLWDKDISKWTEKDIESLKNNIVKPRKKYIAISKQPVKATLKCGSILEFESIAQAVRELNINECTIRSNLNGRQKTAKGIKFERL